MSIILVDAKISEVQGADEMRDGVTRIRLVYIELPNFGTDVLDDILLISGRGENAVNEGGPFREIKFNIVQTVLSCGRVAFQRQNAAFAFEVQGDHIRVNRLLHN